MACLARCIDALAWVIDPNGALIRPRIRPWVQGRATAPGINHAAGNDLQVAANTREIIRRGRGAGVFTSSQRPPGAG